ncbi:MAG: hypothetical protein IT529_21115 [Burkholderiales bacterium]|nr:hypothetical protein [Burkholderiales bacterium]
MKIERTERLRGNAAAAAAWSLIALLALASLVAEISIALAPAGEAAGIGAAAPPSRTPERAPETSDRHAEDTARNGDPFIADDIRGTASALAAARSHTTTS